MGTLPYALSVHSLVNSAGADVGFASLLGLAILVLLFFSQARETATLRQRLDESEHHADSLEARLAELQRAQASAPAPAVAGQPAQPRPGGAQARPAAAAPLKAGAAITASRGAGLLPGAPAGVAAPALNAATRLIPLGVAAAPAQARPTPVPAGVATAGAAAPAAPGAPPTSSVTDDTVLSAPVPATAAAVAANGTAERPRTVTPPPSRPPARGAPAPAGATVAARSRSMPPLPPPGSREPSLARRLVPVLIGLGAVAVIIVVLLVITGGSNTSTQVSHSTRTAARSHHRAVTFDPATVTVAVLNGTAVTNLAHDVALRISDGGYKEGTIATAADQTHATTVVGYLPGHQLDAQKVATLLGLHAGDVQPADSQALGVACPGASATCSADVIVTVGADLAAAAPTTTT